MGKFSADKDYAPRVSMHRDYEQHKKRGEALSARKKQILSKNKQSVDKNRVTEQTNISQPTPSNVPSLTDEQIYSKLEELSAKFRATNGQTEEAELRKFAEQYHLNLRVTSAVSKTDKSAIARMVFNGGVEKPMIGYSPKFADIANYPFKYSVNPKNPEDYNLDDSTIWQAMAEEPRLFEMKDKIKSALAKAGVPKEILPDMNLNDFKYLMFNYCGAQKGLGFTKLFQAKDENGTPLTYKDRNGRDVPICTSAKQENVMRFMRENPQFKTMLMKMPGINRAYVDTLTKKMSETGLTDMSKELERHPEWANQPAIDVHHIINIKDCRLLEEQGKSYAAVNNYENMCIVSNGTLLDAVSRARKMSSENKNTSVHAGIHTADVVFSDKTDKGDIKRTMARLEPQPGVRCMLGFNDDMIIMDSNYQQQTNTQSNNNNSQMFFIKQNNGAARA